MNLLTYIPIPMPIVVHGGGGNLAPCAAAIMTFAIIIGCLSFLGVVMAMVLAVFDLIDASEVLIKFAVVLLALCFASVGLALLCDIIGW